MEERYRWKQMPSNYYANYYNTVDLSLDRKFIIIDNFTGKEYEFPVYENRKDMNGLNERFIAIPNSLWNQDFFNWICSTSPDFCINIPKEFMTPKLIDICINNSSKKDFILEIPNLTQDQCVRFVKRLPMAIVKVSPRYITQKMAEDVLESNPELLIHIPIELTTLELRKSCYERVPASTKCEFIMQGYMDNLLTNAMLRELVDNGYVFHLSSDSFFGSKIPSDIFDSYIASKMFKANSELIYIIPELYITKEMCEQAVKDNKDNIAHVPKEFQIFEIQKISIDQDYRSIFKIPKDFLGDDIITYTLNKNGLALAAIPEARRTLEYCELAVKNNAKALRYVPNKYKTHDMCKRAVMYFPELIKVVPPNILTRQFLMELQELGVIIPDKYIGYVKECINSHDKMENITENSYIPHDNDISLPKNERSIELKNINVNNLSTIFSVHALKQLYTYEITTLEQLFEISRRHEFITCFGRLAIFDEISNTVKLLKCKYLNEDPLIDINDDKIDFVELYKMLGLSNKSSNALKRAAFCQNAKEFFEKMKEDDIEEQLLKIKTLGINSAHEIIEKAKIVINYYDKVNTAMMSDGYITEDEQLKSLNNELRRLQDERRIIDDKIDFVLAQIKEREMDQSKGGIKK